MFRPLKLCCSFEFLFTAFLFAGQFKADARFAFFPVDLTLFFFLITTIAAAIILFQQFHTSTKTLSFIFFFCLFCFFVVLSNAWSQSIIYAEEKTIKIVVLVGWSFLAPLLIIGPSQQRLERFMNSLLLLALWMALEGLFLFFFSGSRGFLHVTGGNYIGLGRILGYGVVASLSKIKLTVNRRKNTLYYWSIFLLFLFVMLMGGARGPLIALSGGWFLAFLLNVDLKSYFVKLRISKKTSLKCIIFFTVMATIAVNFDFLTKTSIYCIIETAEVAK